MVSFKLDPTDPCCHMITKFFSRFHKSSASVKHRRSTITLGSATLSSLNWSTFARVIVKMKVARFYGPPCIFGDGYVSQKRTDVAWVFYRADVIRANRGCGVVRWSHRQLGLIDHRRRRLLSQSRMTANNDTWPKISRCDVARVSKDLVDPSDERTAIGRRFSNGFAGGPQSWQFDLAALDPMCWDPCNVAKLRQTYKKFALYNQIETRSLRYYKAPLLTAIWEPNSLELLSLSWP